MTFSPVNTTALERALVSVDEVSWKPQTASPSLKSPLNRQLSIGLKIGGIVPSKRFFVTDLKSCLLRTSMVSVGVSIASPEYVSKTILSTTDDDVDAELVEELDIEDNDDNEDGVDSEDEDVFWIVEEDKEDVEEVDEVDSDDTDDEDNELEDSSTSVKKTMLSFPLLGTAYPKCPEVIVANLLGILGDDNPVPSLPTKSQDAGYTVSLNTDKELSKLLTAISPKSFPPKGLKYQG